MRRGAECHTDQQLLRLKLRMAGKRNYQLKQQGENTKRLDVAMLKGKSVDDDGWNYTTREIIIPRTSLLAGQGKVDSRGHCGRKADCDQASSD